MRMLVISDLHANWPALEAVLAAEPHDHLLVVGDLVSYGPHAREIVEYVRLGLPHDVTERLAAILRTGSA